MRRPAIIATLLLPLPFALLPLFSLLFSPGDPAQEATVAQNTLPAPASAAVAEAADEPMAYRSDTATNSSCPGASNTAIGG
ncbi:MAG: hypothetical protein ACR2HN_12445 [Tepidiformaceae bacterium]